MKSERFAPLFQYGIIKERTAALFTDALRAQLLESQGYRVQILEFIDMEHTPKNLLIRAVRQGEKKDNRHEIEDILKELSVTPTLYRLFSGSGKRIYRIMTGRVYSFGSGRPAAWFSWAARR